MLYKGGTIVATIKIDKQNLKNKKGSLSTTKTHLNNALIETKNMDIPSNLYGDEAYFLRHLKENITSLITSVNHYNDWIDSSIAKVDDTIMNLHSEVEKIKESKLHEKGNSVLLK